MILNLINRGWNLGRLQNSLQMLLQKVRHSDGLSPARSLDGFQISPLCLQVLIRVGKPRSVDEVEVYVVEAQLLEGQVKRLEGWLLLLPVGFGSYEELVSWYAGCFNGFS